MVDLAMLGGKQKAWKSGLQSSHPFAKFAADGSSCIQCMPFNDARDFAAVIKCQCSFGETTFTRAHCNSVVHQNAKCHAISGSQCQIEVGEGKEKKPEEKKRKWQTPLFQHHTLQLHMTPRENSRQPADMISVHKKVTTPNKSHQSPRAKVFFQIQHCCQHDLLCDSCHKQVWMGHCGNFPKITLRVLGIAWEKGKGKREAEVDGLMCDSCLGLRRKNWSCSPSKILTKNCSNFVAAKDALRFPMLMPESTSAALQNVIATRDSFLSDSGKSLKSICVAHLRFHTSSVKLKNLPEGTKAGPNGFMKQFAVLHEENDI
jgi:hypothetical protein